MIKYGFRGVLIPIFYNLYKSNFFEGKSPFFRREIGLIMAGVVYFMCVDQLASEVMWRDCSEIVKKYTNYSE